VVAGVSYYKVGAPPRIEAPAAFPAAAAEFFTAVYTDGWPSTRTATGSRTSWA
jgi:hypothetical protein